MRTFASHLDRLFSALVETTVQVLALSLILPPGQLSLFRAGTSSLQGTMRPLLVDRRGDRCLPQGGPGRTTALGAYRTRSQEHCQEAVAISEWSVTTRKCHAARVTVRRPLYFICAGNVRHPPRKAGVEFLPEPTNDIARGCD